MSAQRLTPLEAVNSRQVIAWNGITTPEHRIDWPRLRRVVSCCKDQTGICHDVEVWKKRTVGLQGKKFFFGEFLDLVHRKVDKFYMDLQLAQRQMLLSLVKFPFGIHRCYVNAQVLMPGYVSEHFVFQRFFNQIGWMNFVEEFTDSTEIGYESIGFNQQVQTLLGYQLSNCPCEILKGCNGMKRPQSDPVGQLILVALLHDRILEKPLYGDVMGLKFQ